MKPGSLDWQRNRIQGCDTQTRKPNFFAARNDSNDGQKEMSCDQIIVQHFTGSEENVVIYESGGKRPAGRVRLLMGLQSGSVVPTPQTLAKPSKYSTLMTRSGYSQSTTSL